MLIDLNSALNPEDNQSLRVGVIEILLFQPYLINLRKLLIVKVLIVEVESVFVSFEEKAMLVNHVDFSYFSIEVQEGLGSEGVGVK